MSRNQLLAAVVLIFIAGFAFHSVDIQKMSPLSESLSPSQPSVADLVRYPSASTNVEKILSKQKALPQKGFTKTQKSMSVVIESLSSNVEVGDPFTLKATVIANQEISQAEFAWALGDSLEVLSGQTEGDLGTLFMGEENQLELLVRATQTKAERVFLHISSEQTHARIGASGHLNTGSLMEGLNFSAGSAPKGKRIQVDRVMY